MERRYERTNNDELYHSQQPTQYQPRAQKCLLSLGMLTRDKHKQYLDIKKNKSQLIHCFGGLKNFWHDVVL